jgi:hypothetical protein
VPRSSVLGRVYFETLWRDASARKQFRRPSPWSVQCSRWVCRTEFCGQDRAGYIHSTLNFQ